MGISSEESSVVLVIGDVSNVEYLAQGWGSSILASSISSWFCYTSDFLSNLRIPSNSNVTSFIFGPFFPFNSKHLYARLATAVICSFSPSFMTLLSTMSNRRFSSIETTKYEAKLLTSLDHTEDIGFCPVKSSTRTTPKLYTSLFFVN